MHFVTEVITNVVFHQTIGHFHLENTSSEVIWLWANCWKKVWQVENMREQLNKRLFFQCLFSLIDKTIFTDWLVNIKEMTLPNIHFY